MLPPKEIRPAIRPIRLIQFLDEIVANLRNISLAITIWPMSIRKRNPWLPVLLFPRAGAEFERHGSIPIQESYERLLALGGGSRRMGSPRQPDLSEGIGNCQRQVSRLLRLEDIYSEVRDEIDGIYLELGDSGKVTEAG